MGLPGDAVAAFDAALANGDEAAARAVSTGWDAAGDNPSKLFRQGTKEGFRLQALATVTQPDRAIVGTALVKGTKAQRVWLLLRRSGEGWLVAGIKDSPAMAAFFLDGLLPPDKRVKDLPDSPSAAAHVSGLLDPTSTVADAVALRRQVPAGATILQARQGEGGVCHLVELQGPGRGFWVLLNNEDRGFVLRGASRFDDLQSVVNQVAITPTGSKSSARPASAAPSRPAPREAKVPKLDAESPEVRAAMAKVFEDAIAQAGVGATDPAAKEALDRVFRLALAQLGSTPESDDS